MSDDYWGGSYWGGTYWGDTYWGSTRGRPAASTSKTGSVYRRRVRRRPYRLFDDPAFLGLLVDFLETD